MNDSGNTKAGPKSKTAISNIANEASTMVEKIEKPTAGAGAADPARANAVDSNASGHPPGPESGNESSTDTRPRPLEDHPIAAAFPLLEADEFESLAQDISINGLQDDIVLLEGKILDGRNRYRACIKVGVEPRCSDYPGDSPAQFVASKNLYRRNLTASQRATIAVELLPFLQREAKARQDQTQRLARDPKGKLTKSPDPEKIPELANDASKGKSDAHQKSEAREQAAQIAAVNAHYVSDAKRIKEVNPELFQQVKAGTVTLNSAENTLKSKSPEEAAKTDQEKESKGSEKPFNSEVAWRKVEKALAEERKLWPKASHVDFADRLEAFAAKMRGTVKTG